MIRHCLRVASIVFISALAVHAEPTEPVRLPPKASFHLFLLVGQSNMAGRGKVEPGDMVAPARVLTLNKAGEWVPAVDPIHFDKNIAGVGPGRSFGIAAAENDPSITVGLIPCACGGSPIVTWRPSAFFGGTQSHPYDDAILRTKLAMESGTLKGILWHQGETDCNEKDAPGYATNLVAVIQSFRSDLDAPDVPFLIGELGQFLAQSESTTKVVEAQKHVAQSVTNCAFVSSEGLAHRGDRLHFNTESQHELGRRYFKAWKNLSGR